jgi:hypothetical protein
LAVQEILLFGAWRLPAIDRFAPQQQSWGQGLATSLSSSAAEFAAFGSPDASMQQCRQGIRLLQDLRHQLLDPPTAIQQAATDTHTTDPETVEAVA